MTRRRKNGLYFGVGIGYRFTPFWWLGYRIGRWRIRIKYRI